MISCIWNSIFIFKTHETIVISFICNSLSHIVVVESLSHIQLFVAAWTAACQAFLSFTISQSLLKFMSIELVMLSNHLILCHLLLLLPSIFPSIRVFSNESAVSPMTPSYIQFHYIGTGCWHLSSLLVSTWIHPSSVPGSLQPIPLPAAGVIFRAHEINSLSHSFIQVHWVLVVTCRVFTVAYGLWIV